MVEMRMNDEETSDAVVQVFNLIGQVVYNHEKVPIVGGKLVYEVQLKKHIKWVVSGKGRCER